MKNITVFASGRGSNFLSIAEHLKDKPDLARVNLLVSDNSRAKALDSAGKLGIHAVVIRRKDYNSPDEYVKALTKSLEDAHTDLIVLAGYLKLVPSQIVRSYHNRIMNIHPALLPNFGGKGYYGEKVHEAVIQSGVKVSGVTVHFVDEHYDTGPIIAQEVVRVHQDDTPQRLAKRVLKVEHKIYPSVVEAFCRGQLSVEGRKVRWKNED